MSKLKTLAAKEGYDCPEDLILNVGTDAVVPAICTNPGCDYTEGMEPDQDQGWCPECKTNTVVSCLVLGGIL
jgi:hypothetical protein